MAQYASAYAAPKRFQWELNSKPSQAQNCGPSCITQIAQFYNDRWYGIETTRRLVTPCCIPTNSWEQRDMLIRRGVPCAVRQIDTLAELHGLVDSGRRPVLLGLEMSRVPASVRGHPFMGWHALTFLTRAIVQGQNGFWVTDPNFSPPGGIRPDPQHGTRFYSDGVMQWAFFSNNPRYGVVPNALKPMPETQDYVRFNAGVAGVNIRRQPDARKANIFAVAGPRYIVRTFNNDRIALTFTRIPTGGIVTGPDGHRYYRIRLRDTTADTYVQSQFMHRIN